MTHKTPKRSYEAPRIVAREDLKQITLYTGFNQTTKPLSGPGELHWHMP